MNIIQTAELSGELTPEAAEEARRALVEGR